jgi:signal transduction histidine kinase/CheY-like chemotaxis protein
MKLVRKKNTDPEANQLEDVCHLPETIAMTVEPWKILVVDDEPDIHTMTRLTLKNLEFFGKPLQLIQALSGKEAQEILRQEPNMAVALIDVVMEADDAGLQLVDFIRNELKYSLIRLIIRTGQPGMAPEKEVIERYDIDDYKDKTELTAQKLYTTLRMALKSYRDLNTININRQALKKILDAAPGLYQPQTLNEFFHGVLEQMISLCNLSQQNSNTCNGIVITINHGEVEVQSSSGRFANSNDSEGIDAVAKACLIYLNDTSVTPPKGNLVIPLTVHQQITSFIYLENTHGLTKEDSDLIHIMANQCASALQNLRLYLDLKEAHQQTTYMLSLAEQARKMAEAASRAKSTFLAKMSHELRTPLNAILGYSDMIQEEAASFGCEDLIPDLDKVQIAGKQLLDIISNILDISKIEADKLENNLSSFSIVNLIEEVAATIIPLVKIEGNRLEVIYDNQSTLGSMFSDYHKVRQILLNILNNASKFTKRGNITLTVKRKTLKSPTETMTGSEAEWILFQVTDTGIGIAAEHLNLIFEAFTQADNSSTREYGGTGLGLTISQHFCQALGGNISVCSTLGEGSTFTVHLPASSVPKD